MKNNANFRYILDPSSHKIICPNCEKKTFVGIIDQETGEFLTDFGRCDREIKCGYRHFPSAIKFFPLEIKSIQENKEPSFHETRLVKDSMKETNSLLKYFAMLFGEFNACKVAKDYFIGTAAEFFDGTIFWQINDQNMICGGKIICYNNNGKRTNNINWVHAILRAKNSEFQFNLQQCLFGLHLIQNDKLSTIAIVESEKTACIMSVIFPQFIWMACGAKNEFKMQKLLPVKQRKIIAYPDCEIQKNGSTTYDEWKQKAEIFNKAGFNITVSNLLEVQATIEQKIKGIDLADFFMK